jgi:uncharacterized protein with gpF-like domain
MSRYTTSLERAFDLAREGKCNTVADIVRKLNAEGYSGSQVEGAMLRKQLSNILKASRFANTDTQSDS